MQTHAARQLNVASAMRQSLIKPHLLAYASSELALPGVIAEHALNCHDIDPTVPDQDALRHSVVLPLGAPTRLEWITDGKRRHAQLAEGRVIIHPAGVWCEPRWERDRQLAVVAIDPARVSSYAHEMGYSREPHGHHQVGIDDPLVYQLGNALVAEFQNGAETDYLYAESLSSALVAHLVKKYFSSGRTVQRQPDGLGPRQLANVLAYIEDNLSGRPLLDDLAAVAHASPSHFMALFRKTMGISPHQYLVQRRVERAKNMLMHSDLPAATIASLTGFADQSHLTRRLRRSIGATPGQLRSSE